MYNESHKKDYIMSASRSINVISNLERMFNRIEPYENRAGKDLCAMSPEELSAVLDNISARTHASNVVLMSNIRSYIVWSIERSFPGARDSYKSVYISNLKKVRETTVSSPKDLIKFLDAVFPIFGTMDTIYRAWLWLAFCGVKQEDSLCMRTENFDFENELIIVGDKKYPIYKAALRDLEYAATSKTLQHERMAYQKVHDRIPGDYILRGVKNEAKHETLQGVVKKRGKKAFDAGKTVRKPSYSTIHSSGAFYHIYEFEQDGYSDFYDRAIDKILGYNCEQNKKYYIKKYSIDYTAWKLAHNLD